VRSADKLEIRMAEIICINKILNALHNFASANNNYSFEEFIDFCIYPEMVKQWLDAGMSYKEIKKVVFDLFIRYEEQRKLFSV